MTRGRFFGTTKKGYVIRSFGIIGVLLVLAGIVFNPSKQATYAASHKAINSPGDWTTYLWNNARSNFNNTETILNPATAPQLKQHWMYHAGGSINTQPVVVNGLIYWGSWDGYEHATDLNGGLVWKQFLGQRTSNCSTKTFGVASTATVASVSINGVMTPVDFVGGGDGQFYALNAATGTVIWHTALGSSANSFVWASPILYQGNIYIGIASVGDCPLVPGALFQIDATTGTVLHTFNVVPQGCKGAGIWGSPTINEADGTVYFATGNGASCSPAELNADALVQLRASDLSFMSSWRVPKAERVFDGDFGSTPTLFHATINGTVQQLVGVASKNGIYYAFNQGAISSGPVWQVKIAVGGGSPANGQGSISPSAWDGTMLYVAGGNTTINGISCKGSLQALNPATGAFLWQDCLTHGPVLAAVTVVPGVAVVGDGSNIDVVATASGQKLFTYHDSTSLSRFWGAASVSNGVLYQGNMDGILYAFGL